MIYVDTSALRRIAVVEMVAPELERALEGFPVRVRTLDALHLASMIFLRDQGASVRLASYDERLVEAAGALDLPIRPLA